MVINLIFLRFCFEFLFVNRVSDGYVIVVVDLFGDDILLLDLMLDAWCLRSLIWKSIFVAEELWLCIWLGDWDSCFYVDLTASSWLGLGCDVEMVISFQVVLVCMLYLPVFELNGYDSEIWCAIDMERYVTQ